MQMKSRLEQIQSQSEKSINRNKKILATLFLACVLLMIPLYLCSPQMEDSSLYSLLKVPRTPSDFTNIILVIKQYTADSYTYMLASFCYFFLLLQSFGIPGPLVLSIISGALFGQGVAISLVTFCSTVGSAVCYLLSQTLGRGLILQKFPKAVEQVSQRIQKNKHNLFFYLLFLRLTPLIPNWINNLVSPIIGIPFVHFVSACAIGLIPANLLYINMGMTISTLQEVGLNYQSLGFLFFLGILVLIPTALIKNRKVK